ncbi:hypothetical protein NE237_032943 [Protea cynaroides]|uniref:Uncharacterized protein n=1 Tax=Protea cynaroides TaxID=273540 RepID=A0A9Q0L4H2_9MAGN|nr:hypothetical protein NE237_032943 [Protea cynaroides]
MCSSSSLPSFHLSLRFHYFFFSILSETRGMPRQQWRIPAQRLRLHFMVNATGGDSVKNCEWWTPFIRLC